MKTIKNYIIKILGGYTSDEVRKISIKHYENGSKDVQIKIKSYMDLINGTHSDEWCKLVYYYMRCSKLKMDKEKLKEAMTCLIRYNIKFL